MDIFEQLVKKITILEVKNDLADLEVKLSHIKVDISRLPFSFDMGKSTEDFAKELIKDDMEAKQS